MSHLRLKIFILTSTFMLSFSFSFLILPLKTMESFHAEILLFKLSLTGNMDNLSVAEGLSQFT